MVAISAVKAAARSSAPTNVVTSSTARGTTDAPAIGSVSRKACRIAAKGWCRWVSALPIVTACRWAIQYTATVPRMARLSSPVVSTWPVTAAIAAAQTTVPVMAPSPPRTSPSGSRRSSAAGSATAEGLQQGVALGLREVGADQLAVSAVEPLTEAVEVGVLGDHEERGRARGD